MTELYTIGHSTRGIDELLDLLAAHEIALLVDVRRFPMSKRYPHFNREALEASLAQRGIAYRHAEALGGRRRVRKDSPNTAWRQAGFRGYADYMDTPEFRGALEELLRNAATRRTAIMCAEAGPWRCHRRLISDAVVARGGTVRHILGGGRLDLHALNPNASILPGGRLVYPPEQPDLL